MSVSERTMPLGSGEPQPEPEPTVAAVRSPSSSWARWRGPLLQLSALAIVGAALGLLWAALYPTVSGWSDGIERSFAGEVALAGLELVAGLVVAVPGLYRPGPRAAVRFGLSLIGTGLGSVIAWGVGRSFGAPVIGATGVLVIWPLTVAVVTVAVTLVLTLASRDPY